MKAIHLIISPNLDAPHFEEWADHHLSIGFSKFFIYDLGEPSYDLIPIWEKHGNDTLLFQKQRFHPNFSKRKIQEIWAKCLNKFNKFIDYQRIELSKGKKSYYETQNKLIEDNLVRYSAMKINWIANIDADELIFGDIQFLDYLPENIGRVRLSSFIYDNVRELSSFKSSKKITTKPISECFKNIVRPHSVNSWPNVHYVVEMDKQYKMITGGDNLYFNHYCGRKHRENPIIRD